MWQREGGMRREEKKKIETYPIDFLSSHDQYQEFSWCKTYYKTNIQASNFGELYISSFARDITDFIPLGLQNNQMS